MKIIQQGFYIHGKLTIWKLQTEVSEYYGAVGFVAKKTMKFCPAVTKSKVYIH